MTYSYKVKKGDTLNAVAKKFGFANYQSAGVSSVPSGNFDLIREGEDITFGNYDPSKVSTIGSTTPVVSSKDNQQEYRDGSNKVDSLLTGLAGKTDTVTTPKPEDTKKEKEPFATGATGADGKITTTGDPVLDKMNAWTTEQSAKFDKEAIDRKTQYTQLYSTSLAAIDATTQSTLDYIGSTYDKRISEQKRINEINIARVKAYGLGNGGQYTPIDFSDAVSNRETEASDKVASLEGERNSLIAQAKSARDSGQSKLLRDKLTDLDKVDTDIRAQLKSVKEEADKQYTLLRDLRKEEEAKLKTKKEEMIKRLVALSPQYADEYDKLDSKGKDEFINKIVATTGMQYADVYSALQGAVLSGAKLKTDKAKTDADLRKTNIDIQKTTADIGRTRVLNDKTKAETDKIKKEGDEQNGEDFTPTEKKKLEQAGLTKAPRKQKLDFLYDDTYDEANYKGETPAPKPAGTIRVKQKSTGKMGTIPAGEFDAKLYDKI